ncbi:hypothetical protein IHE44_0000546 [Lamprotornis superbus]|uniref:Uncharacterized protein n=1 Tax=Lamprotornis superbus TaxID=245042 RepID=A0A835P2N1_9PASS|nr:hypothetical protein IHE44_0000546 [Lamprotornis superbus]
MWFFNTTQFPHSTPVTPVLEATRSDPSLQPSTELPPDYSGDSHKENGTEQAGNNGVQEGEQTFWEPSGESSAEPTPKPSVEPSQEPTQESSTEMSDKVAATIAQRRDYKHCNSSYDSYLTRILK